MEPAEEIKKLITDAKNVSVIPSDDEGESMPNALALFYTLKELGKNVNLITQNFPERFNFLIPSLDFLSQPKNFIISIPRNVVDVSSVYYEKNENNLKIHLTLDKGIITKDNISFYFSEAKPDLIITLGVKDFQKKLANTLDSFGFILGTPIINIDTSIPLNTDNQENTKFGQVNIIQATSLTETILEVIKYFGDNTIKQETANCLLTGLLLHYNNFQSQHTDHRAFEIVAELIKGGADRHRIIGHLYKATKEQVAFLSEIFRNLEIMENNDVSLAVLDSNKFQNFTEHQIETAIERIDTIGIQSNLLVLWKSHASLPIIKGFFYSKKQALLNRVAEHQQKSTKKDWVFIAISGENIDLAKEQILKIIS